jgi:galactose-1-phosphate uridylyltransferase
MAAFIPVCARYSYEVWVAPYRAVPSFAALAAEERLDFAAALKTVLLKCDGLWDRPLPYVLAVHQAPIDGRPHQESHLHAELYPAYPERKRESFTAAEALGVAYLRDATPRLLAMASGMADSLARRARHVVSENARVLDAVAAMRHNHVERLSSGTSSTC